MSSILRRIQRKRQRKNGTYMAKPQPTRIIAGGYETLSPTRGWIKMTKRRLRAQRIMAYLLGDR